MEDREIAREKSILNETRVEYFATGNSTIAAYSEDNLRNQFDAGADWMKEQIIKIFKEIIMKHYTTIEQSKKLVKLGLNPDTADMCMWESEGKLYVYVCKPDDINCIPCWSLGALLELMPKIQEDENDGGCYPTLCKGYNTDKWHCVYRSSIHITKWYDNSIDAAFEMVCWLLENSYIKKGE